MTTSHFLAGCGAIVWLVSSGHPSGDASFIAWVTLKYYVKHPRARPVSAYSDSSACTKLLMIETMVGLPAWPLMTVEALLSGVVAVG
jgi:hypothetical protein